MLQNRREATSEDVFPRLDLLLALAQTAPGLSPRHPGELVSQIHTPQFLARILRLPTLRTKEIILLGRGLALVRAEKWEFMSNGPALVPG